MSHAPFSSTTLSLLLMLTAGLFLIPPFFLRAQAAEERSVQQSPEKEQTRPDPPSVRGRKRPETTPLNSRELTRALFRLINPEQPPSKVPERFPIVPLLPDPLPQKKPPASAAKRKPASAVSPLPPAPPIPAVPTVSPPLLPKQPVVASPQQADAARKEKAPVPAVPASTAENAPQNPNGHNPSGQNAKPQPLAGSEKAPAGRNIVRAEIRPINLVLVSAPYDGVIVSITARDGDTVRQGQVLAKLDTRALESSLATAKTLSSEAFERLGGLPEGPSRERDALAAEYLRLSAAAKAQEIRLAQSELTAPFTGRITELRAKAGEHVKQGSPVLEMAETGALEIACAVPSAWVRWLKPGHIVWVYVDETAKSYEAVLTRLGGKIDPESKTITLYARFSKPPGDLLPGMSGSASIRQRLVNEQANERTDDRQGEQ